MILVTGATGFVGNKIMECRSDVVAAPSLRNVSEDDVKAIVENSGADAIIHTAAISNVNECEKNPEASYMANVKLPMYLAKAAGNRKLICFSSDQVYNGLEDTGPYTEDKVNPVNTYAKHKLLMEQKVLDICPDAVMLRAEWMYDYCEGNSNYYMKVVDARDKVSFSREQYRGIAYVREVADNMENALSLPGGVYNFGSETTKSMYGITRDFIEAFGLDIELTEAPPAWNLWMDCSKAKKYGVVFSDVSEGLIRCAEDNGMLI